MIIGDGFRNGRHRALLPLLLGIGAVWFAACLVAVGTARAEPGGVCVTARVDQPIRLPDGSVHPSGLVTFCDAMEYSPVASLQKVYVNGKPVGIHVSRKAKSEIAHEAAPLVVFNTDGEGHLELVGYVVPGRVKSVTYLFAEHESGVQGTILTALIQQPGTLAVRAAMTAR